MESNDDTRQIQLLDLPGEVLLEVLTHLPQKDTISITCKQLYSLICDYEKDKHHLDITYSELVDSDIMQSIINSQRMFKELRINLCHCQFVNDFVFEKIEAVIEKFGDRLKTLKFWNSIQSKPSEINESQLCSILNSVPLLEEFIFKNIYVKESEIDESDLNLKNLKSLILDYCLFDTPNVLLKIPRDVLTNLTFTFEPNDEQLFQEFFNRQSCVKKLELFENDKINFEHLELHHLKISSNLNFSLMIQQQQQLRFLDFAITWVNDETFEQVCNLKHLEVFRTLVDLISLRVFKGLQDIPSLKELRIDSHSSYDMGYLQELSLMKGMRLEKLTLLFSERKINAEIVQQLANNFHHLKHVEIINRSINILDTFIQHFPKLNSILLDYFAIFGAPEDTLTISNDEIRHENLKQLVVTNVNVNEEENGKSLLKLVGMCGNLERIMLSKLVSFTNENLMEVLTQHSKLTHLSIEAGDKMDFNDETVQIISSGIKLKHFRLCGFKSCQFNYKTLKEIFRSQFPIINLFKYSSNDYELIMKKGNVADWHNTFKLMDHF
jgi:hypothetical protein